MLQRIISLIRFVWDEQDRLCPHCGYLCAGKTVFCLPPSIEN